MSLLCPTTIMTKLRSHYQPGLSFTPASIVLCCTKCCARWWIVWNAEQRRWINEALNCLTSEDHNPLNHMQLWAFVFPEWVTEWGRSVQPPLVLITASCPYTSTSDGSRHDLRWPQSPQTSRPGATQETKGRPGNCGQSGGKQQGASGPEGAVTVWKKKNTGCTHLHKHIHPISFGNLAACCVKPCGHWMGELVSGRNLLGVSFGKWTTNRVKYCPVENVPFNICK